MAEKHITKNLATCLPSEFLRQTGLAKNAIEKWLSETKILEIRKRKPFVRADATDAEKEAAQSDLTRKNLSEILDAVLTKFPEDTLAVMALLCCVDPAHVDDYPMEEYMSNITALMNNKAVIGFFTSLGILGQSNIFG